MSDFDFKVTDYLDKDGYHLAISDQATHYE